MDIPVYRDKKELFAFLIENKDRLITMKKSAIKYADSMPFMIPVNHLADKEKIYKANQPIARPGDQIRVLAAINTTRFMDSHDDVHIDGLWDKSLRENKIIMHLQEHAMQYDHIIADGEELKAFTKYYDWKDLGYDHEGQTQVLVFDSTVKRDRNKFMFDQYAKGYVKNHSVGMQYVKLLLAVNDEEYKEEFAAWNEFFDSIANKSLAEEKGYFYPVKEAKVIEGSAVPVGSNRVTPTIDNNVDGSEPFNNTLNEPDDSTQEKEPIDVVKFMYDNLKLLKNG